MLLFSSGLWISSTEAETKRRRFWLDVANDKMRRRKTQSRKTEATQPLRSLSSFCVSATLIYYTIIFTLFVYREKRGRLVSSTWLSFYFVHSLINNDYKTKELNRWVTQQKYYDAFCKYFVVVSVGHTIKKSNLILKSMIRRIFGLKCVFSTSTITRLKNKAFKLKGKN